MIEIKIRKRFMVKPAEKTDPRQIGFTVIDRINYFPRYNSVVHIYRPTKQTSDQLFADELRVSLGNTLVHFYPMAGRCNLDAAGMTGIDCNDSGVPFVEAETDSDLKALGDLAPSPEMSKLLPTIHETSDYISSYPMLAVQVTYFKCGGVCLGFRVEHHAVDASSFFHLIKSWSEIARGVGISTPPFLDRASVLCPRDPPSPIFDHPEYPRHNPSNKIISPQQLNHTTKVSIFRLTKTQLSHLKDVASKHCNNKYTVFALLAGHIWKCVCVARGISFDEETRLIYPVNARFGRLINPKLPPGFFGNALFRAMPIARAGDLVSKPLWYAAGLIHEALARMDDEYLRSMIDHLSLLPDLSAARGGPHLYNSPNFQITSWARLGLGDADFGWGPPVYSGPGAVDYEKAYIFSTENGGEESLSVTIALQPHHMEIFNKLFYDVEGTTKHGSDSIPAKL